MKKLSIEFIRKSFESVGYNLLTKKYINSSQKLEFICPKGHRHSINWNNWKTGNRCGKCSNLFNVDYKSIKDAFELECYELLSTVYKNALTKLDFKCPKGHISSITWGNWKTGHRCNYCKDDKRRLCIEDIQASFERDHYNLLTTEYINAQQQLEFICPKGHRHYTTWNIWNKGIRCGICAGRVITFDVIIESFRAENYNLISESYSTGEKLKYICPKGHYSETLWGNWVSGYRCPFCSNQRSKAEEEIKEYLESYEVVFLQRDRNILKPKELDFIINSKKVAIEYCGLRWHSERFGKDRNYHIEKLKKCEEKGYRLITIFEDEWINHKDIVKSRLKQILGISDAKRVHARNCEIREITTKKSSLFLKRFHIQGVGGSSIRLGAFYRDELVSIMTFSRPSIAKGSKDKDFWELNRFCSHSYYHIPGIASKLLKHFERNYDCEKIISYADRRWSNGNLYNQLGFEQVSETKPNYWYLNDYKERIHRFNLRKKPDEPKNKTEWELRQLEGWDRIWDCGSLKFEKRL